MVAPPVESLDTAGVLHRLDTPDLADALAGRTAKDEALAEVSAGLAEDQARLQELATAYGDRQIGMRERLDARKPIEARIEAGQRQIARTTHTDALHGLPGHGRALQESWESLNLTRQAAIISAVLDHAVIAPGTPGARNVDPSRVQPVWRL